MNCVELKPHTLVELTEKSFQDMIDAGRKDPASLRYVLPTGETLNVEISAEQFLNAFLRLTMQYQHKFWKNILEELDSPGAMVKLTSKNSKPATFVRGSDSADGSINLRVSP